MNKDFSPGREAEVLHISYEDLLEKPEAIIKNIIEFCNLEAKNRNHEKFLQTIDKTRKFAFVNDSELVEFYQSIKNDELVVRLGYGDII